MFRGGTPSFTMLIFILIFTGLWLRYFRGGVALLNAGSVDASRFVDTLQMQGVGYGYPAGTFG